MNSDNTLGKILIAAGCAALLVSAAQAGEGKHRARMDQNGDGKITVEEIAGSKQGYFNKMDLNGDGYMTREEIEEFRAQMREKRTGSRQDRFDAADANGDGKVSAEEFSAKALERSAKLDSNGDGEVSREEFRDAMKSHRKGWHHGGKGDEAV